MSPPDRCWWCDHSRPKGAGLCLAHAWLFGRQPGVLARVHAEIRADRRPAAADAVGFLIRAGLIVAGIVAVNAVLRALGVA